MPFRKAVSLAPFLDARDGHDYDLGPPASEPGGQYGGTGSSGAPRPLRRFRHSSASPDLLGSVLRALIEAAGLTQRQDGIGSGGRLAASQVAPSSNPLGRGNRS